MKVSLHCKFCQLPITVEIDDEYAKTHDRFKLLRYCCCNHCADVRVTRRYLQGKIESVAIAFAAKFNPKEEDKAKVRDTFTKLLVRYAKNIASFHRMEGMAWDDGVVDAIMSQPNQWAEILTRMHQMFRDWQQEQRQKELQTEMGV